MENKYREFWIVDVDFDLGYSKTEVAEYPRNDQKLGSIHVVEIEAVRELERKLESAIIQRNNMIAQYCDGAANACYREHVRTCDENLEKA